MQFLEELYYHAIGTAPLPSATEIVLSSVGSVPSGSGLFVSIVELPGLRALRIQNSIPGYERPAAQVTVRAGDYATARLTALALHSRFNLRNQLVGAFSKSCTITRSGTTATVSCPSHDLLTGQSILIAGADQGAYNGTFTVTRVNDDVFTYTVVGAPATPATGTITASFLGTKYLELEPMQPPFDMEPDSNSRPRVVFNVRAVKVPS